MRRRAYLLAAFAVSVFGVALGSFFAESPARVEAPPVPRSAPLADPVAPPAPLAEPARALPGDGDLAATLARAEELAKDLDPDAEPLLAGVVAEAKRTGAAALAARGEGALATLRAALARRARETAAWLA